MSRVSLEGCHIQMDISSVQLRQFLSKYFDGDELHDLCFDYFPRVQQEFTSGMVKSEQIRLLLTHCRNHGERDRLIGALQESRPGLFQQEFELAQPMPTPAGATAAPTIRNPRQIFISHAYEDAKLAQRLAADLGQRGWQVWIAPDSIQPGEKWVAAINRGLAESGVLLLLVSQHGVQSRWVNSEADIAVQWEHEGKMRFIPVQTSSRFISHVPAMWQRHQDISFAGRYQDGLAPLLTKLEQRPYVPPPPPPSQGQRVMAFFAQIPMMFWGGVVFLLIGVVLIAWLFSLFGGGGRETKRESEATQVLGEIAVADTAMPTATRQPSLTPTIATATPTATDMPEATATLTAEPSDTPPPPTPTYTPSPPTATNDPNIPPSNASLHDTWLRPKDEMTMVFVPSGTFLMGSDPDDDPDAQNDEQPQHQVTLGAFWLDQTEVTNEQFGQFVTASPGYETTAESEGTGYIYMDGGAEETAGVDWQHPSGPDSDLSGLNSHPVVLVSWEDADAYCEWAGGSLPTEAQWEYAARGKDSRLYPWGNEFDGTQLNFCDTNCEFSLKDASVDDGYEQTAPVGNYSGDSWVGAQDMAGNVWEWVADWYGSYSGASQNNPTGPADGTFKVLRGGAWNYNQPQVRVANRGRNMPVRRLDTHGFRCVVSPGN